jgi:hypothetical protein
MVYNVFHVWHFMTVICFCYRRGIFCMAHKAAYSVSVGVLSMVWCLWVRCVPKGQYKAIQGNIDGFRITAAYAWVTGRVFSIWHIKPPIAFLLAHWVTV